MNDDGTNNSIQNYGNSVDGIVDKVRPLINGLRERITTAFGQTES